MTKLNWPAVREIRNARERQQALATRFGVTVATISRVQNGRAWWPDPEHYDEDDDFDDLLNEMFNE